MASDVLESIDTWRAEHDQEMRRRLSRHVAERSTDFVAAGQHIAPAVYTDAVRWEAEKREIFGKMPLVACLTQDMPNHGDVFLFEQTGVPILLVRDKQGTAQAFLNMCTHRASKLALDCGRRTRLTCPFHAWTFDLQGKLIGLPRREAFDAQDLQTRNLIRVPVGEWGGLVMIKTHPGEERIDVKSYLGSFAPTIASLHLDVAAPVAKGRLDYATNWKYALDTNGEGYHISALHPKSVGALYYGDLIATERYGKHHEQSFAPNEFAETVNQPEEDWVHSQPYSPVYFVYPNYVINVQPMPKERAFITIQSLFPGANVGEGFVLMNTYKRGGELSLEEHAEYVAGHELIMRTVGTEDFSIAEGAYKNLINAPPGFKSVFGRNEILAAAVQRHIAADIGMPLPD